MERRPIRSFFLFVLAFVLLYVWSANDVPPWGFIPFGIAIAIAVIYGVRAWRGTSGNSVPVTRHKRAR